MPSRNRFQYQAKTQSSAPIVNPTQAHWFTPWVDPVRPLITPAVAVVMMVSGAFAPTPLVPITNPTIIASQGQTVDAVPTEYRLQYQTQTTSPNTVFPETVTESRWHQPWSEPVRVPPRDAWFQPATPSLNPTVSFTYYNWLTEPVRTAPRDAWYQPDTFGRAAPFPEEVSEDRWHQPWSEPVRVPLRDAWFQDRFQVQAAPFPETVTESRWHQAWSEPVRVAPRAAQFSDLAWSTLTPVSSITTNWFSPLGDPVRTPLRTAWFADLTWNPSTPPTVTIVASAQPDVSVSYEARFQYQAAAAPVTTPAAAPAQTYPPWSDPPKPAARDAWYQPDTFGRAAPFSETVTESRWHQAWSEPVRVKPRAAQFSDLAWNTFTPAAVTVPAFAWFGPLSDPVRPTPVLREQIFGVPFNAPFVFFNEATGSDVVSRTRLIYQSRAQVPFTPVTPTLVESASPPVSVVYEARLQYQALAEPATTPSSVVVPVQSYYSPWRDPPVLSPRRTVEYQPFVIAPLVPPIVPEATTGDVFFEQSLIYPDIAQTINFTANKGIVASGAFNDIFVRYDTVFQYQTTTKPLVTAGAETITADKWAYPWSEPVRFRAFPAAEQQTLALDPFPRPNVTAPTILLPAWSVPVRSLLRAADYPAFIGTLLVPPIVPEATTGDIFFEQSLIYPDLAEDPQPFPGTGQLRPMSAVDTAITVEARIQYQAYAAPIATAAAETTLVTKWYRPLNEPPKVKTLGAYLQLFVSVPNQIIPGIIVTGTMLTTELGDQFIAGGIVFNRVASAEVGVKTQHPSAGETGIITSG